MSEPGSCTICGKPLEPGSLFGNSTSMAHIRCAEPTVCFEAADRHITRLEAEVARLRAERDAALRERDAEHRIVEETRRLCSEARAESAALRSRLEEATKALQHIKENLYACEQAEDGICPVPPCTVGFKDPDAWCPWCRAAAWLAASGPKEGR